jgi:hypothetical protein
MTKREKQALFWQFFGMLLVKASLLKTPVIVLEWLRIESQQVLNVAKGVSKTMKSKHLEGLACDIAFLSDIMDDGSLNYTPDAYKALGEYWESLHPACRWGGRFGDDPNTLKIEGWDAGHFELNV